MASTSRARYAVRRASHSFGSVILCCTSKALKAFNDTLSSSMSRFKLGGTTDTLGVAYSPSVMGFSLYYNMCQRRASFRRLNQGITYRRSTDSSSVHSVHSPSNGRILSNRLPTAEIARSRVAPVTGPRSVRKLLSKIRTRQLGTRDEKFAGSAERRQPDSSSRVRFRKCSDGNAAGVGLSGIHCRLLATYSWIRSLCTYS